MEHCQPIHARGLPGGVPPWPAPVPDAPHAGVLPSPAVSPWAPLLSPRDSDAALPGALPLPALDLDAALRGAPLWLARGEDALPAGTRWLAAAEAARAEGLPHRKRRTEYLLRRLVAKHAVAAVTGRPADPAALSRIEVANAPDGAPEVLVDGQPLGADLSITDRAGWAVCVLGHRVGCDLELVEPRSAGFVQDFFTEAEQRFVARADGPERAGAEQAGAEQADQDRDVAANLIWSAKESTLKVLRTGLRRDTRSVEVAVGAPAAGGWGRLSVRSTEGGRFAGWWRHDGRFVLTVVSTADTPPPVALGDPSALTAAQPRHSWYERPPG